MAFDISKYTEASREPDAVRDIGTITTEILRLKQDAGNAILSIGQRLIEAKAMLPHGEWLPWLTEQVEFSERTARNFMRLAREWTNRQALADLGAAKALTLLVLPPEERERFMEENHVVDGEEKSVIDMTSRELEKAVKERDEALHAAEAARAAAETADQSRAKMEADMTALKQLHQAAQAGETQAREALAKAQAELKALREKPVEVAVEVDQKALQEARRKAETRMQAKVDKAAEAQKKAEEQRKKAEEELAAVRQQLEAAQQTERQAAISGDKDLALFELLFSQGNEAVNKLHGLLLKVRGRGDIELAGKLQKALLALADVTRRCAEE
ncbi:DUF3102 domain-containing protein [Oscillibacter sp.]|uniref:DUF3102 domain-containing protein n=1 Tax=Oscillibacter sp. TaxID=1945593 RepID=UPI002D80C807|nr:DUF3102 domain-containing protein [Oscillibacter sp.]MBS6353907.1 DUF3102 domain-containing protein [Oscillibacter sp.]